MNNQKRAWLFFLSFLGFFAPLLAQNKVVEIAAIVDKERVSPGDTFQVKLQVQAANQPVAGVNASLAFNPTLFKVTKIQAGETLPVLLQSSFNNQQGKVTYAAGVYGPLPTGTFNLADVQFEAIGATGEGTITFVTTAGQPDKTEVTYYKATSVLKATSPATILIVANKPPVAHAGADIEATDQDNNGKEKITLNGAASKDEDGTIVSYVWKEGTLTLAESKNPTAEVELATGTHKIKLFVTDDQGATASDEVTVTINALANKAPVAHAGADQTLTVTGGNREVEVTLDGSASRDPDGSIASYRWTIEDKEVGTTVRPTVQVGLGTTLITLTVTDDKGLKATDEVSIVVNLPGNQTPVAHAGADQELTDTNNDGFEEITLDASGSKDNDGKIAAYDWKWSIGSAEGIQPRVKLPTGKTTLILTVTDEQGAQATDTVVVTIHPLNQAPVADAGPDQHLIDEDGDGKAEVQLDGSRSKDEDGMIKTYEWTYSGLAERMMTVNTKIYLPVGMTEIILTVTDDKGAKAQDTVVITIQKMNAKPVARAGSNLEVQDEDGDGKAEVTLDGSASEDSDGKITRYAWYDTHHQSIATGATVTLTFPVGISSVYLVVTDNQEASDTAFITITVLKPLAVEKPFLPENDVLVYPNPAQGSFLIQSDRHRSLDCYLFNAQGSLIAKSRTPDGKVSFDTTAFPAGVYYLIIQADGERTTRRLIIY